MNVEVDNLPNCIASLRIELSSDRVTKEWNEVVQDFRQAARIPGFRPGKAPAGVVEAKYRKQIQEELTKKLVAETTREAIRDKGLKVLSISGVDDVEFTPEKAMRFTATLITAPEFELPDYKNIPIKIEDPEVSEQHVQSAIQNLRESRATFSDFAGKDLEFGDFAVIDYSASLEDKPLLDVFPKVPKMLAGGKDFWIKLEEHTILKGFGEQLVGMRPNDSREFYVPIDESSPIRDLAGRTLHFTAALKSIKEMHLPEIDDGFASQIREGMNLEQLKEALKQDLTAERNRRAQLAKRNQIIDYLVSRVECELPQSYVKDETRRIMSEIVQANQSRGVSEEVLRENQKDIVNAASRNARERLKANFILAKIAEKEKIEVSAAEFKNRVRQLADQYRMGFDKMMSQLDEKEAVGQVREELLIGKVLDFLTSNATIEIIPEQAANS